MRMSQIDHTDNWPRCTHLFSNSDERGAEEYAGYAVNCEESSRQRRRLGRPHVPEILTPALRTLRKKRNAHCRPGDVVDVSRVGGSRSPPAQVCPEGTSGSEDLVYFGSG